MEAFVMKAFNILNKLRLENFFCCVELERGGSCVGWTFLVIESLIFIANMIKLIYLSVTGCDSFEKMQKKAMKELEEEGGGFKMFEYDTNCTSSTLEFAMILCIVVTALVGIVCSGMLIKGTKERELGKIKPMMFFLAFAVIYSILEILSFAFLASLRDTIICFYSLIVVFSLHERVREQREQPQVIYCEPGAKV